MDARASQPLTRRHLVTATVAGALLGSAWSISFREATSGDDFPAVTVACNGPSIAGLIEYRGHRILLLDGSTTDALQDLTELVAGFMKQRVDTLLATATALAVLPTTFRSRWKITGIHSLPDNDQYPAISLAGRELRVGELHISSDRLVSSEWTTAAAPHQAPWYLVATYQASRIVFASSGEVLGHVGAEPSLVTCVVCNDEDVSTWPATLASQVLAIPADADLMEHIDPERRQSVVPLHRDYPVTFRLTGNGIELPSSY